MKTTVSIAQAADQLGVTGRQVLNLCDSGQLHGRSYEAGEWRIRQDALEAFVAEQGGLAAFHASLRADEREDAARRRRAVDEARATARRLTIEALPGLEERAREIKFRNARRDHGRRLAQARKDGVETQFLAAERARREKTKREKAATTNAVARRLKKARPSTSARPGGLFDIGDLA